MIFLSGTGALMILSTWYLNKEQNKHAEFLH